jgi:hypothetical protein
MWIVLGVVVVCGVIVLEVAVSFRARLAVIEARDEAEDWRRVAENLSGICEDQWRFVRWPDSDREAFETSRLARVTSQLNACREAYPVPPVPLEIGVTP